MKQIKIIITGASGRMGKNNISCVLEHPAALLAGAIDIRQSAGFGCDAGAYAGLKPCGIKITADLDELLPVCDAIIDFSTPSSAVELLKKASAAGKNCVIGTTGFSQEQENFIRETAGNIAVVKASNFSCGITLLLSLVNKAASALDDSFNIEIIEKHHNRKKDAPSGTALSLAKAAALARGLDLEQEMCTGRSGSNTERTKNEIGVLALRGGNIIGEHSVFFISDEEVIELKHSALSRRVFSAGALNAALFLQNKTSGFFTMNDVLGV